ncbi:hypothetical protein D3C81_2185490 [compost metagenome]
MQAEADQHQQHAKAQGCTADMPQAGAQAMAGASAQGNDIDRARGNGSGQREGGHR